MKDNRESRLLRLALLTYPRQSRRSDGDVISSLALDMVDSGQSTTGREALGLVRGGMALRAGDLAKAPWGEAIRRISLPIAVALLAVTLGSLAFWLGIDGFVWPGWAWAAALAGPGMAICGLLLGWRLPVLVGAGCICAVGVAQGNGVALTHGLDASADWLTGGINLPLFGGMIPAGLLILAAGFARPKRAGSSIFLATIAWVVAGAIAARLLYPAYVVIGGVTVNGLGICLVVYGALLLIALLVGIWRRKQDPAGFLAGLLGFATVLPLLLLYGLGMVPLSDEWIWALLLASALLSVAVLVQMARLVARTTPGSP